MLAPARILAALFQGGGNIALLMPVLERLIARGHAVRIMVGPGVRRSRLPVSLDLRRRIASSGAVPVSFCEPDAHPLDAATRPKGAIGGWVPPGFRFVPGEAETALWAPAWARNVTEELRAAPTDLVVADFVLLGALVAAEAAGTPAVALMHAVAPWPRAGVPPYGPGWLPRCGPIGSGRDLIGRTIVEYLYRHNALPTLNRARTSLGLVPLRSPFGQYDRAARVLMLVSKAFDHPPRRSAADLIHVGTPIGDAADDGWASCWPAADQRPLILVSLSTIDQGQAPLMRRILQAVAELEARVLVTLGPALNRSDFEVPPNVRLERFIPHSAVLPHVAAVVTQCGLGTLTKALVHGLPLLCIPMVGDQFENAARVVACGAGIRLRRQSSSPQILAAIRRLVTEPAFAHAASAMAAILKIEQGGEQKAVEEIEGVLKGNTKIVRCQAIMSPS
jgi:MGT family glycosyltransferase